jgi:hypothetical protein
MEEVGFLEKNHICHHWVSREGVPTVRIVGNYSEKGGGRNGGGVRSGRRRAFPRKAQSGVKGDKNKKPPSAHA